MTEPRAYLNGNWIAASQLSVPVWDAGFVQGVTVAEQLRTFGGKLFRLDAHLERLARSLAVVGIELPQSFDELGSRAVELAEHNHRLLPAGSDLGLSMFATPGAYAALAPAGVHGPTVAMHTYPVAFAAFAAKYERGERLVTTDVTQVPDSCWPTSLKCRSRMHYYLADQAARQKEPGARALMLDVEGWVTEASTANLVVYRRGTGLVSPPREKILPGISVDTLEELARGLQIPFVLQDLRVDDVITSDEVYLSSTSPCLLPVVAVNGQPIGTGHPGTMFERLIQAWSSRVGIDIVQQARDAT